MGWIRERGLTLALLVLFAAMLLAQIFAGRADYNHDLLEHGASAIGVIAYLRTGHMWEATFENWESEFLQMAVFVMLTVILVQKGSPESRRPGAVEPSDADPREYRDQPGAPWPVRRGGLMLWFYQYSLGLAFALLFLLCWVGHAVGGWRAYADEQMLQREPAPSFADYVTSSRFWFESMQNWQSEFLAIAAMVWLSVYLRHRGSPESKPVHAGHGEN